MDFFLSVKKRTPFTFAFRTFFASSLKSPTNEGVIGAHALRAALRLSHNVQNHKQVSLSPESTSGVRNENERHGGNKGRRNVL